ncbi:LPPG:FO 2-phospho-L-lactate transferase [Aeromicrobium marinum DSM 15272]|uniref:LPPG:FO 2-phospho-L-lactate transferase n=1 Tax=Aeromicrobium marinum DSM 15272 TaxID=585531 RepID=E2SFM5_9ACTN|nr:2-phospho-L-lactate transferase [Aeromicrobium marinum]EFQ81992.1 LPPG:FO 2-phospho-L-lactate transferase [Aeromicrobium marinum DSM 15272]
MKIVVVSGGVGGARFLQGLVAAVAPADEVTVVVNTADDLWLFGLRVCPDLDTVMYTLGDGIDTGRGWGRTDETWNAKHELAAYGLDETWFGLGDRDLATHLLRSMRLREGRTLSEATDELVGRWSPGTDLGRVRVLPMSDDEVETHIATTVDGTDTVIHFQEFWIRHGARVPVRAVEYRGIESARPAPGVLDAIAAADVVVLPPSNPIVSVGPVVAVPGVAAALRSASAPVVGVSPIISGAAVRGMADQLLTGLGVEVSAGAVARHHGARSADGILDGWLVDTADADQVAGVESAGISCRAVPLWMRDPATTRQLATDVLGLAGDLRDGGR